MPAVSNSSPLILFASIGRLDLLQGVFGDIYVPDAVWREVVTDGGERLDAVQVVEAHWIKPRSVAQAVVARELAQSLGDGEAEAIALALEIGDQIPLLLDDRKARAIARRLQLNIIGNSGLLVLAKNRSLIALVRPILDQLHGAGLYLDDAVRAQLLRAAGEPMNESRE
ncbi:MAG TPA: DUF3368 domain-containing protein [Thermomicrobiaceae bacterium]|nr:DUF3368 domain-containing protein [Thermomicrobiaceae bacterium]